VRADARVVAQHKVVAARVARLVDGGGARQVEDAPVGDVADDAAAAEDELAGGEDDSVGPPRRGGLLVSVWQVRKCCSRGDNSWDRGMGGEERNGVLFHLGQTARADLDSGVLATWKLFWCRFLASRVEYAQCQSSRTASWWRATSGLPWPCGVEVAVLGLSGRWQAQSAIKRRQSQVLEILAASSDILPVAGSPPLLSSAKTWPLNLHGD
jgi:hypothetical protein